MNLWHDLISSINILVFIAAGWSAGCVLAGICLGLWLSIKIDRWEQADKEKDRYSQHSVDREG